MANIRYDVFRSRQQFSVNIFKWFIGINNLEKKIYRRYYYMSLVLTQAIQDQ